MQSALGAELEKELEAQMVFVRRLVPYLAQHGAMSLDEIQSAGISLFDLALEDSELEDVLELARR